MDLNHNQLIANLEWALGILEDNLTIERKMLAQVTTADEQDRIEATIVSLNDAFVAVTRALDTTHGED